jgi:hypothetical protein
MSKITEEQLKTANENQEKLIGLVNQIGMIETQKHALLHQVADVNKKAQCLLILKLVSTLRLKMNLNLK